MVIISSKIHSYYKFLNHVYVITITSLVLLLSCILNIVLDFTIPTQEGKRKRITYCRDLWLISKRLVRTNFLWSAWTVGESYNMFLKDRSCFLNCKKYMPKLWNDQTLPTDFDIIFEMLMSFIKCLSPWRHAVFQTNHISLLVNVARKQFFTLTLSQWSMKEPGTIKLMLSWKANFQVY